MAGAVVPLPLLDEELLVSDSDAEKATLELLFDNFEILELDDFELELVDDVVLDDEQAVSMRIVSKQTEILNRLFIVLLLINYNILGHF